MQAHAGGGCRRAGIVRPCISVGDVARAWIGRQHSLSDTAIRKRAKANGWTGDLSGAVRSRIRESLVREGVRANLIAGVRPSEAAIVDAAARGVDVVSCNPIITLPSSPFLAGSQRSIVGLFQ